MDHVYRVLRIYFELQLPYSKGLKSVEHAAQSAALSVDRSNSAISQPAFNQDSEFAQSLLRQMSDSKGVRENKQSSFTGDL
jgi:hypothetical protein